VVAAARPLLDPMLKSLRIGAGKTPLAFRVYQPNQFAVITGSSLPLARKIFLSLAVDQEQPAAGPDFVLPPLKQRLGRHQMFAAPGPECPTKQRQDIRRLLKFCRAGRTSQPLTPPLVARCCVHQLPTLVEHVRAAVSAPDLGASSSSITAWRKVAISSAQVLKVARKPWR
jgi:hypothetical protein